MKNFLFTALIEEQTADEAFIQAYWAHAPHMGMALDLILDAARANGCLRPMARQCDPFDLDHLEAEVIPSPQADVFWADTRHYFPPEAMFDLPLGIIASCIEGDHDVDEINRGFTQATDDGGLMTVEVNVELSQLMALYSQLLQCRQGYKVFWYILHDFWEDEDRDKFLVNEALSTADSILNHLVENSLDAIKNGFVTLTAYIEEGATNLKITDHKRIAISSYSAPLVAEYTALLRQLGYPDTPALVSIDDKMHHWHYRVRGSKSKTELIDSLKAQGFKDWIPGAAK